MSEIQPERIQLGQTGLMVSPIGVGTNAWGINRQADPAQQATFEAALAAGINLIDTAEIYDFGGSERTLGQFLPGARDRVVATSKFLPLPWRLNKAALGAALRASLANLRVEQVDLYLLHFPWPPLPIETWMEALADARDAGLVKAVGISNCNVDQTRRAHEVLAKRGIPLACNQVEFSLLKRDAETSSLLALAGELGFTLVAYRPLAGGLLSGRYTQANISALRKAANSRHAQSRVQSLVKKLSEIGQANGKSPNQVALNWLICKGALPIPGASRPQHVVENAGALGWRLSADQVAALDAA